MARWVLLVVGVAVWLVGSPGAPAAEEKVPAQAPASSTPLPGETPQDESFLRTAPSLLEPTIGISRLGAEKAKHQDLVAVSRRMADEYTVLLRDVLATGKVAGIDVPEEADPQGVNRLNRLESADFQFDLTYVDEQLGLHNQLIAMFSMEERAGKNRALKKEAKKGSAMLVRNLAELEQIGTALREERTTPGR